MANHKDFAIGEVLTAPSPATTGTSLVLKTGQGADMPPVPFYATVIPPLSTPTKNSSEKILVTARTGDTITFERAKGGTTAKSIDVGWIVVNSLYTAEALKVGDIFMSMRATPEAGRLFMNGATYNKSDYPLMYAFVALNTTYGVTGGSAGSETFTLTDMTTRVPVGKSESGTFSTLAAKGGAETHTLTIAEMPSHTHTQNSHNHSTAARLTGSFTGGAPDLPYMYGSNGLGSNASFGSNSTTATNQNTGGGGAHNNLQPYIVVNYEVAVG